LKLCKLLTLEALSGGGEPKDYVAGPHVANLTNIFLQVQQTFAEIQTAPSICFTIYLKKENIYQAVTLTDAPTTGH
jgi:hypothetical protein